MSATTTTGPITATDCPSWCTEDLPSIDGSTSTLHTTAVDVGGLVLDFSKDPDEGDGPHFIPPDYHEMTLPDARRYALALLEAVDRIEAADGTPTAAS